MSNDLKPEFYKKPFFVIAMIFVVLLVSPKIYQAARWTAKNSDERFDDTASYETRRKLEDTIEVVDGKLIQSDFESQYSASSWYQKFTANKVAFDRDYNDKILDVTGEVTHISNENGCATVEIDADDTPTHILYFSNCPRGNDKWSDQVAELRVGQNVHLRGKYSALTSTEYAIDIYGAKVITP